MSLETSRSIATASALSERLSLSWIDLGGSPALCIEGWTDGELEALQSDRSRLDRGGLAVYPAALLADGVDGLPGMAGSFEVRERSVVFMPKHPPVAGSSYALVVRAPDGSGGLPVGESCLERAPAEPVTSVSGLYPTASRIPLNHLRFYLHFSCPMSEGQAARSVRLRDALTGEELRDAFLPTPPELWDSARRRLTLLLDPGRIKRGLAPHEEAGYPLAEGAAVTFEVDASFRDAKGQPLVASFERTLHVGPPIRERVRPSQWRIFAPPAGSRSPLRVEFGRVIDHALGERCLSVTDAEGDAIAGALRLAEGETVMEFRPSQLWRPVEYLLCIDGKLEDVAGNSVLRPFDRDLTLSEPPPPSASSFLLRFTCT